MTKHSNNNTRKLRQHLQRLKALYNLITQKYGMHKELSRDKVNDTMILIIQRGKKKTELKDKDVA